MTDGPGREARVSETFVALADTLVADFDVVDLLSRLAEHVVDLLLISAAGILLADQRGTLDVVAASSDEARLLELLQLQHQQGPCVECYTAGRPVTEPDVRAPGSRWPLFSATAAGIGFRSVHAFPLRLRDQVIGALNLCSPTPGPLPHADRVLAQAFADVATIGILQERAVRRQELLAEQLQSALTSRVVIEQAKGVLAARGNLPMDEAFDRLRRHARNNNLRLTDLARDVVDRTLTPDAVLRTAGGARHPSR